MKLSKGKIAAIAAATIAGIIAASLLVINESITNEGIARQNGIETDYKAVQLELSNCIEKTGLATQVTEEQTAALNEFMHDAITGRYEGLQDNQAEMFSMIQEDYPELESLSSAYEDLLIIATGCRDDYYGAQKKLQDRVSKFDTWREGSFWTRWFAEEFPTDSLQVTVNDQILTGQEALAHISEIAITEGARDTGDTGVVEEQDLFSDDESPTSD